MTKKRPERAPRGAFEGAPCAAFEGAPCAAFEGGSRPAELVAAMADEIDTDERLEGASAPRGERSSSRFAFEAPTRSEGLTGDTVDSSAKTTVRGPARASGEGGGAGGAGGGGVGPLPAWCPVHPFPMGHSVLLCASDRADDAPECVRSVGARLAWAELRAPGGGLAEVVYDALASLERLEEVLARLGDSAGVGGAYQARLAEGLAHSLRDVLDEFGGEVALSARGAWWVPLCRQG